MPDLDNLLVEISQKFEVAFEQLQLDSNRLELLDIRNMPSHLDRLFAANAINEPLRDLPLWAKVWPGALILGRFLRKFEPQGKTLLELGCGMGALSLVASQYGFSRILATDIAEDALKFARANILHNNLANIISTRRLDLHACAGFEEKFAMIAASELLYLDDLHRPLLKFLNRALAPGGRAFFCTDLARLKPRFQKLAARNFAVTEGKIAARGDELRIYSILILERQ